MTHTPLTKAERDELPARIQAAINTVCSGMAAMRIPANPRDVDLVLADCARALADLDAAETERETLRQIAEGCCNATDGGCSPGVSVEFLRGVPKEVGRIRDQRDRAEAELDAERRMRVEAEAAARRAEEDRDALIRNINDAFQSLNTPHSTLAFDGRNLLPHAEELARYAEAMRIERDKALSDVAKYADRSESFASAIDHLVCNTADGTDLARITKERDDFRDGMVAMLVAAGAPVDLDAMEAAVSSAGKKPSDFISQRIRVLTAERDALWVDHRDVVDERDALKAREGEWADQIAAALNSTADKLGRTPSMIAGHVRREHEAHTACFDRLRRAVDERDALKAKLAALVEAVSSAETILGNMAKETGRVFGRWEINHEPLRNDAQRMLPSFRSAIAAARGGAQ